MAKASDLTTLLAGTALFGVLSEGERTPIARLMRSASFEAGALIFARGDPGEEVYLVTSGRVRLSVYSSDGRELAFLNAGPGEVFGEIAVLDGGARTADARALARTKAVTLSRASLDGLIGSSPAIARSVIAFLCARLRATNDVFEAVALHSLEVRLARFLLSALRLRGAATDKGRVTVDLGLSQTEIALLIGASRPKVNLALQALESEGAIERQGSAMTCNMEALKQLADRDEG